MKIEAPRLLVLLEILMNFVKLGIRRRNASSHAMRPCNLFLRWLAMVALHCEHASNLLLQDLNLSPVQYPGPKVKVDGLFGWPQIQGHDTRIDKAVNGKFAFTLLLPIPPIK